MTKLASKEIKDMTRSELEIRALQIGAPTLDKNLVHEELFQLKEEDRINNNKKQDDILNATISMRQMTIYILILTAISAIGAIIGIIAFFKQSN